MKCNINTFLVVVSSQFKDFPVICVLIYLFIRIFFNVWILPLDLLYVSWSQCSRVSSRLALQFGPEKDLPNNPVWGHFLGNSVFCQQAKYGGSTTMAGKKSRIGGKRGQLSWRIRTMRSSKTNNRILWDVFPFFPANMGFFPYYQYLLQNRHIYPTSGRTEFRRETPFYVS